MTRGKKLGVLFCVFAVAVAGCFAAKQFAKRADDIDKTSVMNIKADSITGVDWTYNDKKVSIEKSDGEWKYKDAQNEEDKVDSAKAEDLTKAIADLKASSVLTKEEQEGDYGFDSPKCVIDVTTDTATTTYTVGNTNEITNEYYLKITGSENIFMVNQDFVSNFEKNYDDIKATPAPTEEATEAPKDDGAENTDSSPEPTEEAKN